MTNRSLLLAAGCTALGFAAGLYAASAPKMIVTPSDAVTYQLLDPARPTGPTFAVLRGDPATGPSTMLMKFGKFTGRMHIHSADYDLVVLKGEMKHWGAGETEATAKAIGPGGYWFQPGGEAHADGCLSDECLAYVQYSGKRDSRLAE